MSNSLVTAAEFEKVRFFRPPAWRSIRAGKLLAGTVRTRRKEEEDPLVLEYVAFKRTKRRLLEKNLSPCEISRRLYSKWPTLYLATEYGESTGYSLPVGSLQAHLLTTADSHYIGNRFQIDPTVVDVYEKLFYDVRDRLDNVEYIAGFVIGPVFQAGLESLNVELMAKYFGYFGGLSLLQLVIYGATRDTAEKTDDEVLGYLQSTVGRALTYQTASTALLTQPNRFDLRTLVEGYVAILSLDRRNDGDLENNWIVPLLEILRSRNPMPRKPEERERFAALVNAPRLTTKLEPRALERRLVAAGHLDKDQLEQRLDDFRMPSERGPSVAQTKDR